MKSRSIYFLQALWDIELQQEQVLQIAKNAMISEMDRTFYGVLHPRTLWVSDESKKALKKIQLLKESVNRISKPRELFDINDQYVGLTGKIRAMQIKTAQTLDSRSGVLLNDLHIIARQLLPYAAKKITEQIWYQLYRLLVLDVAVPKTIFTIPTDSAESILNYYISSIIPLTQGISEKKLDSRWAYERKIIHINERLAFEQFVSVDPEDEEFKQPLGIPSIGTGINGEFRIYGRGKITNLTPRDLENINLNLVARSIDPRVDFSAILNENSNPLTVLNNMYRKTKYLISPSDYFEYINRSIIANTFYKRVKMGLCLYCGSPLYANKCIKCEIKWNV